MYMGNGGKTDAGEEDEVEGDGRAPYYTQCAQFHIIHALSFDDRVQIHARIIHVG